MSNMEFVSERVCYVNCNFCNTILAVSVPCSNLFTIVTVRCGHCANLLSVNMAASLQIFPTNPDSSQLMQTEKMETKSEESGSSSKSKCNNIKLAPFESSDTEPPRMAPIRPPEKRQRVPSAYNKFIKEEIQRIKASNPDITHREAFSTAAKNWAHFPHIHFGLKMEGNKHGKLEQSFGAETKKINGYYDIN